MDWRGSPIALQQLGQHLVGRNLGGIAVPDALQPGDAGDRLDSGVSGLRAPSAMSTVVATIWVACPPRGT